MATAGDNNAALEDAARTIEQARVRIERLEPRLRRFYTALADLGILDLVGRGWVRINDSETGFSFADLDDRAFDRLVGVLEGRGGGGRGSTAPTPGQLALFPHIVAPVSIDRPSPVHVELPR